MRRLLRNAAGWAALIVAVPLAASPIDYDGDFGTAGVATLPYTSAGVGVLMPDGGVALAVTRTELSGVVSRVIRLTPAGAIDPAFVPLVGAPSEQPVYLAGALFEGLAAMPDGRLAALETQSGVLGICRSFVRRHLADGRPDPSFTVTDGYCGNGIATTAQGDLYAGFYRASAYYIDQSTGVLHVFWSGGAREVLGFMSGPAAHPLPWTYGKVVLTPDLRPVALARPAGSGLGAVRFLGINPDPGFGTGGLASVQPVERVEALDIALASDGGVLVAGLDTTYPARFIVAKFTRDGRPDESFGSEGLVRVPVTGTGEELEGIAIAVQPDGKLLLAGTVAPTSPAAAGRVRIALARLTSAGLPDDTFAPGGVASLSVDDRTWLGFLLVRADGRIVLGVTFGAHGGGASQAAVVQLKGGDDAVAPWRERDAVEYFHARYGHYFVSADGKEIAGLDATPASGWNRTGQVFRVWDDNQPSLSPVCRFWSDRTWAPKSSHFYTHDAHECAKVKLDPAWRFEGIAFHARAAQGTPGARTCPAGSQPLYRAYNDGKSGAPNHRYTTDPAVLDAMIAQGWTMEGEAVTRVFACVPVAIP